MTVLSVVKDVCAVIGVLQPTSLFAGLASSRTQQELLALANEMAQRVAYNHREWTMLKTLATFTGDGIATSFSLPANYKRMLLQSNVWRSSQTQSPMRFMPNLDQWVQRTAQGLSDNRGEWTIYGGQLHIRPTLAGPVMSTDPIPVVLTPAQTATFNYLDKNCIALASGGYGDVFTDDADGFRLDERLLKLGMIWQWKAQKGSAYAEDLSTYGDAVNAEAGADQPAPILLNRGPISTSASLAYPGLMPSSADWHWP